LKWIFSWPKVKSFVQQCNHIASPITFTINKIAPSSLMSLWPPHLPFKNVVANVTCSILLCNQLSYNPMDLCNHKLLWLYGFGKSHHCLHCRICMNFFFLEEMEQWTLMAKGIVFVKKSLFKFKGSHWFQKLMLKGVVKQITLQIDNQASTNPFLFYGPFFLLKT